MFDPLSLALRSTTSAAHGRAENSSFVDDLLQGRSCRAAFTALTVQLSLIYDALEDAIGEHAGHHLVAAVDDRRLDRRDALRQDLAALLGPERGAWRDVDALPVVPATRAYVDRLREADAETVLAHHYVRYLGDLSGGQVIGRLVQRHYGVPDEALNFYRFAELDKLKPYKDDYRARLDAIELTLQERTSILERAVEAFELNEAVFAGLSDARVSSHASAGVAA